MRGWSFLFLAGLALTLASAPAPAADLSDHIVFEQGDHLLGRIGREGTPEILSDSAHYEKVETAASRYYILLRSDDRRSWLTILQCDSAGVLRRVRTISNAKIADATAILSASFVKPDRLAVTVHLGPERDVTFSIALGNMGN